MRRGENLNGKPGPGRPRGRLNKLTVELKAMIENALDEVGGQEYLVGLARKRPELFVHLVARIIPRDLKLGTNADPIEFTVVLQAPTQKTIEQTEMSRLPGTVESESSTSSVLDT